MSIHFQSTILHAVDTDLAPGLQPYRFGPLVEDARTTFRLWAPGLAAAELIVKGENPRPMQRTEDGFFALAVDEAGPGTRYKFRTGDLVFPDLASRQQPSIASANSPASAAKNCGRSPRR